MDVHDGSHDDLVRKGNARSLPLAIVHAWREEILAHEALGALRAFNTRIRDEGGLGAAGARAFVASLYAFNRAAAAGIAQLAGRWADARSAADPWQAHRIAARLLASAVDEFGLAGTPPHIELLAAFGARWGISPSAIADAAEAVPAARVLGSCVEAWYRSAPLSVALVIHFVSEETSAEEFAAWQALFSDADYTRVHARLEPGHSSDAEDALARQLAAAPDDIPAARHALHSYLLQYRAMWEQLFAALAGGH